MILKFLITILITLALLTGKAYWDVYRQKRGIWTPHKFEWTVLFIITICVVSFTMNYPHAYPTTWHEAKIDIVDLLFLGGIGFLYFDPIHNIFAGEKLNYFSPPSVHQSMTDRVLNWVGRRWQYELKFGVLIIIVVICYFILKS